MASATFLSASALASLASACASATSRCPSAWAFATSRCTSADVSDFLLQALSANTAAASAQATLSCIREPPSKSTFTRRNNALGAGPVPTSNPVREHVDEELLGPLPHRALLPGSQLDGARGLLVALKYFFHLACGVAADDDGIHLVVVQEAAHVEIR